MFYAAAPQADEVGWGLLFKEEHEETIMQEDMSEKPMQVNETIKNLVDKGACLQEGLWLGGEKYKVVQKDMAVEEGEHTLGWILATRSKKGVHIIVTNAQILVVNWDEEKGQTAGNCKKVASAFGAYLVGMGY
ncbi:unnamed protein product [Polarella glacialis]|uniref:Profilin n=1 Tax=Polarella glacialis TaxID=89957 RepID=A0A813HFS3_POLGL|nr:unnamed protein product [Polarella glacialis]CAE8645760.1 unnamed protein product [Polarella glacialis]